jgi:uncharacterized protein
MFEKFIAEQNPHWRGVPLEVGYPREVTTELKKFMSARQIVALVGIRRCGKSTVLRQIINHLLHEKKVKPENILFLNLESPLLARYKTDPANLQRIYEEYLAALNPKGKVFVFLDEVQFFSDWQVFIKSLYEKGGVKFFVTGSNSRLLSSEMATILSGRSITKNIYPFSFREILKVRGLDIENKMDMASSEAKAVRFFRNYLKTGGFPEIVLEKSKDLGKEIMTNYYKNILYQDIIPRFEVKKMREIENLLLYLFSNIGQEYSYNSLGKYLKIQDKTVKDYVSFFEKSFLLFEISNYQYSIKKQENYPKRSYSADNGFIDAVSFSFSENFGRFLENTVFVSLLARGKEIFYHREKFECDFLIKEKTKITQAIQVTKELGLSNEKREFGGLLEAMEKFKLKTGLIVTENQEEERKVGNKRIRIMPAWKWLLEK